MPKTKVEIKRQVEICRDEAVTVEVDVPAHVLDGADSLFDWVEREMENPDSELKNRVTANGWDNVNEDETIEYTEVFELGGSDN